MLTDTSKFGVMNLLETSKKSVQLDDKWKTFTFSGLTNKAIFFFNFLLDNKYPNFYPKQGFKKTSKKNQKQKLLEPYKRGSIICKRFLFCSGCVLEGLIYLNEVKESSNIF